MKFHVVIPTLRLACSTTLANHAAGKITENSALAIAFLADDTPEIFYAPDIKTYKCPSEYRYAAVLLGSALAGLADTFAGLELPHEQATERMAGLLLANLSRFAFETKLTDSRIIEFASSLDRFAINGIVAGITTAEMQPLTQPIVEPCESPRRN